MSLHKQKRSNSQSLWQRSLQVSPGGVHSPVRAMQSVGVDPIFFERAKGAHITDVGGISYIDFCMSFGPLILGHCDQEILGVVQKTAEMAWSLGTCEPYSLELAEFITSELEWIDKIRFVSSGTEAVMSALRLARAAKQKSGILKFAGCYHGHVDAMLVAAGSGLAGQGKAQSAGLNPAVIRDSYVLELDDSTGLDAFFMQHAPKLAAVIIEPLPANSGLLIQQQAFLEKLAHLCKKHGVLLIFDEVISGFRVGLGGMSHVLGIQPDIICLGKVIGGGFPVGAYAAKKDLMDFIAPAGPVYQAGTLSANPFGMRAGLATLQKCKQNNFYNLLEENTVYFCDELSKLLKSSNWKVVNYASLFWLEWQEQDKENTPRAIRAAKQISSVQKVQFANLFQAFLKVGVYLPPSGFEVCFLSLAHTRPLLDEALDKMSKAIRKLYFI